MGKYGLQTTCCIKEQFRSVALSTSSLRTHIRQTPIRTSIFTPTSNQFPKLPLWLAAQYSILEIILMLDCIFQKGGKRENIAQKCQAIFLRTLGKHV